MEILFWFCQKNIWNLNDSSFFLFALWQIDSLLCKNGLKGRNDYKRNRRGREDHNSAYYSRAYRVTKTIPILICRFFPLFGLSESVWLWLTFAFTRASLLLQIICNPDFKLHKIDEYNSYRKASFSPNLWPNRPR